MEINSEFEKMKASYLQHIDALNEIGIALCAEKSYGRLLEKIVDGATKLTNADGGTLYLKEGNQLTFGVLVNRSLNLNFGFLAQGHAKFKPIPLYYEDNQPNVNNIVSYCVLRNETVNINDAYHNQDFDFSGPKLMDEKLHYHSQSFLAIPLRDHENKIIGALQLINAMDEGSGKIVAFSEENVHLAESLASQAAITLTQHALIAAQKKLFDAFIQLIAQAIDEKSVYTSQHCARVPVIAMLLAEAAQSCQEGSLKNFSLSADQMEELRIAAWLHDCGKITTPEFVVDKSTKLETITDRIEVIDLRFEVLRRDLKIAALEKQLSGVDLGEGYDLSCAALNQDQAFIRNINAEGKEALSETDQARILSLANRYRYQTQNDTELPLLTDQEVGNLSVQRGTLTDAERAIIQNHVSVTWKMLTALPYPDYLKNVPEIASSHHERIDGQGYPRQLKGDELSTQARILAIADIFEALTAADRPYKKAKKLSETLGIMENMKRQGHIDPDLFDLFVRDKVYLTYAEKFLNQEQIDC